MAKYKKVELAKKYKESIYNRVEKYMEDKEEIIINSGQLKFFKGLLIRHIAVSTNIKIKAPRKRMKDMIDAFLGSNDEVIEMFDWKKNMEAFMNSAYCGEFPYKSIFKPEYGAPPFLLLQKAQGLMEANLVNYIRVNEKEEEEKQAAYLELLLSISLYEILLREYYDEVCEECYKKMGSISRAEDMERLNQCWQEIEQCEDQEEKEKKIEELVGYTYEYYEKICKASLDVFCIFYFVQHIFNLYAMLRVIVLIEVVSINLSLHNTREEELQRALIEAKYWLDMVEEFMQDRILFGIVDRKKNLSNLYEQLNILYRENEIFPLISADEQYADFAKRAYKDNMCLKEYIEMICHKRVENRNIEEERNLWQIEDRMAIPILCAVHEIAELQNNAERERKRKGELLKQYKLDKIR